MRTGSALALLCAASLAPRCTHAEVVPWLYDVEVQVESQSAAEQRRASRLAFEQLLARLTGMVDVRGNPAVRAALARPGDFYVLRSFVRRPLPRPRSAAGVPAGQDAAEQTDALYLNVRFNAESALSLLRRAELPVWGVDRPSILAWVAIDAQDGRHFASADDPHGVGQALLRHARRRGLPLFLPTLDLADRALPTAALLGRFQDDVAAASQRYPTDLVLTGRLVAAASGWRASWKLFPARENGARAGRQALPWTNFDLAADEPGEAVQAGIDGVADELAARFAARGRREAIEVSVRGAQTVLGHAALLAYLEAQEYIESVEVSAVDPQATWLRLHARSSPGQLAELLSLGGLLTVAVPDGAASADGPASAEVPVRLAWLGSR